MSEERSNSPTLQDIHEVCGKAGCWPKLWPEIKDLRSCYFTANSLVVTRHKYETEGDPRALLEAVRLSYSENFELPHWAHFALADASHKYLLAAGGIHFDELIKLKTKRKGPSNTAFKRRIKKWQHREAVFQVWILNKGLGFTIPVSCLIASKLQHSYIDVGKEIPVNLSADHINDLYRSSTEEFKTESPIDEWFGDDPNDHLQCYIMDYESVFKELVQNGEFWQKGLLKGG